MSNLQDQVEFDASDDGSDSAATLWRERLHDVDVTVRIWARERPLLMVLGVLGVGYLCGRGLRRL